MLNANQKSVLRSVLASAKGNGYDFGFTDDVEAEGLDARQVGAYLSQLSSQGMIEMDYAEHLDVTQITFPDLEAALEAAK